MGTVVNGNVWAGACVDGNIVSGLVKNGVVFYKREVPTPSIYKRRIMVGDNLYQVKISSDYPENFYEVFPNNPIQEIFINTSGGDMSFQTTVLNYSYGSLAISSFGDRLKDWYESSSENVTTYGNQETIFGNSIPVSERNNYNVTEIVNNENSNSYLAQAYRHLFIDDPNIRPIQVGDKVVSGTKFYGVVPDDYNANNINSTIQDNNNNTVGYFSFYENTAELWIKASSQTSVDYIFQKNPYYSINNSRIISQTEYTVGSITNETNPNFAYLLVDTTTLGE